jgi:membrane protein
MQMTIDERRARERGRGREADLPAELGWAGWNDVVWRVITKVGADRIMLVAAGVTFYMLLALIPGLSALVSLYGLFFDPADVGTQMALLSGLVPAGGLELIEEQLMRLTSVERPELGWALAVSVAIALWSASAGVKAIFEAMNVVNGETEKRSFVIFNGLALLFTLGAVIGAVIAMASVVVLPLVLGLIGVDFGWLAQAAGLVVFGSLVFCGIALVYRFGPSRREARWRWVTPGAIFSVVTIVAFSALFSWYSSSFANYDKTYGSLGALVGFLLWIWISVAVVMIGAELNAEAEHQTSRDTTERPDRPLGERGAYVADTLGRSRVESGASDA